MISSRPLPSSRYQESRDGIGCGDHDVPYTFEQRPTVAAPFPFSTRQFARLLILRSKVWDTRVEEDCRLGP
jgi:hypothetical protein